MWAKAAILCRIYTPASYSFASVCPLSKEKYSEGWVGDAQNREMEGFVAIVGRTGDGLGQLLNPWLF